MSLILRVEGSHPLHGEITAHGAKNFVPKAMVVLLPADAPSEFYNISLTRGTDVVSDLLSLHGVRIDFDQDRGTLCMDPSNVKVASRSNISTLAGVSQIPILSCGPLLYRLGKAFTPELGGCVIGDCPIDFHLETLRKFGAIIDKQPDGVHIRRPSSGLHGAITEPPFSSVGTAEQTLLTAVRNKGITTLKGMTTEPEILDSTNVLQKMGAIISVNTDRTIRIEGVAKLNGYHHTVLPDRVEAASWGATTLAAHSDVYVRDAYQPDMTTFLNTFRKMGDAFDIDVDGIRFYHPGELLHSIALETTVYPSFMTNWRQPLVVTLTQVEGLSIVHETVHENHFDSIEALCKMGASIRAYRECLGGIPRHFGQKNYYHSAVTSGPISLHSADIEVPDLRGGFSHLIAALAASGTPTVSGADMISRGYEHFTCELHRLDTHVRYLGT